MWSVQLLTASEKILPSSCLAHISIEQVTAKIYRKQIKPEAQISMKNLGLQFVIPMLSTLSANGTSSLPTQLLLFLRIWQVCFIRQTIPASIFPPLLASLTIEAVSVTEDSISSGRSTGMVITTLLSSMDRLSPTRLPKFNKWNQGTTDTIENFTNNFTGQGLSYLPGRIAARTGSPLTPLSNIQLCISWTKTMESNRNGSRIKSRVQICKNN